MLSASLASVEAYDAFSLSPMTVVARVLASRRTSVSRNSRDDCLSFFCRFERLVAQSVWLAQTCDLRLVAAREGVVKSPLGEIDLFG